MRCMIAPRSRSLLPPPHHDMPALLPSMLAAGLSPIQSVKQLFGVVGVRAVLLPSQLCTAPA